MSFVLTPETVVPWLVEQGLTSHGAELDVTELAGGVSAAVIAVRGPGLAVVVKQALPRLRVTDEWLARIERTETEARAMQLCGELTPGAVPRVLALDANDHVAAMELVEDAANWQAEVAAGRAHVDAAAWAGEVLGTWHRATAGRADIAAKFPDFEAFEEQRLRPFHETVMERRPQLAAAIAPYVDELRRERRCLVHGDYAMKNILVAPAGRRVVLDFEVAHVGNPVFDLGFFLSFAVLSAVRWPALAGEMRRVADDFLASYRTAAGQALARDAAAVTGHTACLVLARTDGKSPAQFLDEASRLPARTAGIAMLDAPQRGLWAWLASPGRRA